MENLELKANENLGEIELRCKGWCHDSPILEVKYNSKIPPQKYFC